MGEEENQAQGTPPADGLLSPYQDPESNPEDFEDSPDSDSEHESDDESSDKSSLEARRVRKKRKRRVNPFIDIEAVVDEDDEDYEGDSEYEGADESAEEELLEDEPSRISRPIFPDSPKGDDVNMEEIAKRMKRRYGWSKKSRKKYLEAGHIPSSALAPSIEDPKLWICEVKEGKRKEVVDTLMRKYLCYENTENKLELCSVFYKDSLKRYIYVEARRQIDVQKALENINYVLPGKLRLVPMEEMVSCLKTKVKNLAPDIGKFVRPKRGLYAADLARTIDVLSNGDVLCELIPRLRSLKISYQKKDNTGSKSSERPPKVVFNPHDYKNGYKKDGSYYIVGNNWINKKGLLEKAFKPSSLIMEDVQPTFVEVNNFAKATGEEIDLSSFTKSSTPKPDDFQIGDTVVAISGSIQGTRGVITSIQDGIVSFIPETSLDDTNPERTIQVTTSEVRKQIKAGDYAIVVNGVNKGVAGIVVDVSDGVATIISDGTLKDITAFTRDIRCATRSNTYDISTSAYSSGDFVIFVGGAGVVIRADRDGVMVLNHLGQMQELPVQKIRLKPDLQRVAGVDSLGNTVFIGSCVDIISDPRKGNAIRGTVISAYKNSFFIHSSEVSENSGILVAKSESVYLLQSPIGDNVGERVYTRKSNHRLHSLNHNSRFRRDPLIAKSVVITGGSYKGYAGIVKDICDTTARVELHSKDHIVAIDRSKLRLKDEINQNIHGRSNQAYNWNNARDHSYDHEPSSTNPPPKTPAYSGRTPAYFARTPNHYFSKPLEYSARTPINNHGRNLVYNSNQELQPSSYYHGRTPAWNPNIATNHKNN